MKKIILVFCTITLGHTALMAQAFDSAKRVRNLQKGWRVGAGIFHSRLVNSDVYQSETLAEGSSGVTLGVSYDHAPWGFDAGYYTATVAQKRLKTTLTSTTDTARLLMLSVSGHLNLLWHSKFIYPYVGAGFQYSSLSSESIDVNPTNAFLKAGIKLFFAKHRITVKAEYQRGIPAAGGAFRQNDLEMATVGVGIRLFKPTLSSM